MNTEQEQAYWEDWNEAALRGIIQRQRKITKTSKKMEMKKLYQVLVILDDVADMPQLHKPNGALDTLFIRGRHMQISTVSSQSKSSAPCCRRTSCTGSTSRRLGTPTASSSCTTSSQRMRCSTCALKSVSLWRKKPMGAALSFLGQKLFASSTLISARFENISCTSVAAIQSPVVRRTGGFFRKGMTTIYVDSRNSKNEDASVPRLQSAPALRAGCGLPGA